MPFKKGNKLGEKGKGKTGMRKKMFNEVSEQLISLSPVYNELLENEMQGMELTDAHKDGMNRFERMYEYARPKLARQEISGLNGGPLEHQVTLDNEQATNLATAAAILAKRSGEK